MALPVLCLETWLTAADPLAVEKSEEFSNAKDGKWGSFSTDFRGRHSSVMWGPHTLMAAVSCPVRRPAAFIKGSKRMSIACRRAQVLL